MERPATTVSLASQPPSRTGQQVACRSLPSPLCSQCLQYCGLTGRLSALAHVNRQAERMEHSENLLDLGAAMAGFHLGQPRARHFGATGKDGLAPGPLPPSVAHDLAQSHPIRYHLHKPPHRLSSFVDTIYTSTFIDNAVLSMPVGNPV